MWISKKKWQELNALADDAKKDRQKVLEQVENMQTRNDDLFEDNLSLQRKIDRYKDIEKQWLKAINEVKNRNREKDEVILNLKIDLTSEVAKNVYLTEKIKKE